MSWLYAGAAVAFAAIAAVVAAILFCGGHKMKTVTAVLVCLVAYAVYIPAAFVIGRDHIPGPRPEGAVVATMDGFHVDHPDGYFAQPHISQPGHFPDTSIVAIDQVPMLQTDFASAPETGDDVIRFKAGDGSHLRRNERGHWVSAVSAEDVLGIALAMSALYAFVRLIVLGIKH